MTTTNSTGPAKKLLLVEDEKIIREALRRLLEKEGFEVTSAENGKLAQDLLARQAFDVVLSDIYMPSSFVSGLQLLHNIKRVSPSTPVILMTGMATLTETQEAHSAGANGFLAKPFKPDELIQAIRKACGGETVDAPPEADEDEKYCKLGIDDFISGREIRHNVFVRISPAKYLKIAHKGEDLNLEQIRGYKGKGIRHLYLLKKDFYEYMKFNLGLARAARASAGISREKKVNLLKHTGELVMEHLYSSDIEDETFEDAKAVVDTTISFMVDSHAFDLLDALNAHSDSLYAHCLGVSLYAAMIAREVGWKSPTVRYKVSMAGLLHDIGLKEIDRAILGKSRGTLSVEEVKNYETHTIRGMEILSRGSAMSEDILQIVLQHHERDHGTGYPSRLNKARIHPLARLIAVADEFCELALKSASGEGLAPQAAAQRLVTLYGSTLDPGFTAALLKILKV